ncbi:MAG: bifunctional homocysteine S-methyltransferase/methylenetetrahydrofolate reductase [Lachnospiraceae bacterium]|nr:bifunctional homocysteine S-methyltransferase/methylenetetrahydrofolate reductase [Lachnospiraceae bacterium]
MKIQEYLKKNRLLTDGAMGTYFEDKYQMDEQMAEAYNIIAPEKVKQIHLEYIDNGAKLIRTNTFAANTMFFENMDKVKEIVRTGYEIAKDAVEKSGQEIYIAADIGPIYDTGFLGENVILEEYYEICDTFLSCGAEIFVLETQSEFTYIQAVTEYLKKKKDVFIIVQFSVDKSGYTRHGLSMEKIIQKAANMESIDAYGFNCGVGAAHLAKLLKKVTFPNEKYITALPNAGYPIELRGRTVYGDNRTYFLEMMEEIAGLGVEILGGCCGTTPEYICQISQKIEFTAKIEKKIGIDKEYSLNKKSSVLEQKLEKGEKAYIVELDPPFDMDISKVMQGAIRLKSVGVDLLTLADSPMARARMDAGKLAAKVQREVEIPVMPHICCRDKNVIAMRSGMLGDYMNNLRHFLIVTGDPVAREAKGNITPVFDFNSIRFMEYLSQMNEDVFSAEPVCYGGALNYHGANPDAIIRRMEMKIEKGCSMFLTQPVYSKEDMERIAYIKERTNTKIMCGIMPLVSYKNAMFMANEMPGIRIPEEIIARYSPEMTREEAQAVGISIAVEIAAAMKEIVDGFYFMTPFNRTEMIAEIIEKIKDL